MLDSETLEELANLRFAATRFEQLFHGLPLACIGMDSGGTIFEWNRAGEKLIGLDSTSLFLSSAFTVLCPDEAHRNKLYEMLQGMANGQSYESFEWVFSQPGGPTSYLLCSMLPKPGPNGELVGATWAGIDMTAKKAYEMQIETQLRQIHEYSLQIERSKSELEDANRRLEALASTDGLTGLANHRSFFEALRFLFTKPKKIASIIMLDVDNFKTYNDTYGHPEGDSVLRLVSKSLLSVSREGDTVARYGGVELSDRVATPKLAQTARRGHA